MPSLHIYPGVNGDTVDVIFGNISDIIKVETTVKQSLEEVKTISPPMTLQAVASVFYNLAQVILLYTEYLLL